MVVEIEDNPYNTPELNADLELYGLPDKSWGLPIAVEVIGPASRESGQHPPTRSVYTPAPPLPYLADLLKKFKDPKTPDAEARNILLEILGDH